MAFLTFFVHDCSLLVAALSAFLFHRLDSASMAQNHRLRDSPYIQLSRIKLCRRTIVRLLAKVNIFRRSRRNPRPLPAIKRASVPLVQLLLRIRFSAPSKCWTTYNSERKTVFEIGANGSNLPTVLSPVSAIKRAVVYGFGNVGGFDFVGIFEISNRAADFQDAIIGSRGETQTSHGAFQHRFAFTIDATVTANPTRRHRRIREDSLGGESLALPLARFDDALANRG